MATDTPDLLLEGTLEGKLLGEATPQGWREFLGSSQVEVTQKSKFIEVMSSDRGSFGAVVATASKPDPTELKIKLARTTGIALGMALMGDDTGYTQSSGTVSTTPEAITAILGQGVDLAHGYVSNVVVKSQDATPVTYVAGVDYAVNPRFGSVTALAGGAITDGESLDVTYSYAAVGGRIVQAATRSQWTLALRLDGLNKFDGKDVLWEAPKVVLSSDGGIDFKSDKPIEPSFTGRFFKLPGQQIYTLKHALAVTA